MISTAPTNQRKPAPPTDNNLTNPTTTTPTAAPTPTTTPTNRKSLYIGFGMWVGWAVYAQARGGEVSEFGTKAVGSPRGQV